MEKEVKAINHLEDKMYIKPKTSRQIMSIKETKETLMYTQNEIMACGDLWTLKVSNIGGMKEIRLIPYKY
jgi:hypothetical protein